MKNAEKIQRISVTERVVAYIQEQIDNKVWLPGEKIESETQISEKLGVSRVTVRNAVRQFIAFGVLESIQGKGTFLKNTSSLAFPTHIFSSQDKDDIRHILQVRATIEPDTAYFAAQNATQVDIDFLKKNHVLLMEADKVKDTTRSWEYDRIFHLKIAEMSANPYYSAILTQVMDQTHSQMVHVVEKIGSRYANHFHPLILEAITQHNAEAARYHMREHMTTMIAQLDK